MRKMALSGLCAVVALALIAVASTAHAQQYYGDYGGWHGPGMMGYGMMGPGMMHGYDYGYGPDMMYGPGYRDYVPRRGWHGRYYRHHQYDHRYGYHCCGW